MRTTIPPCSGYSLTLNKGDVLRIIDVEGQQVSDLVLFDRQDHRRKLSTGKTLDFEETLNLTQGNFLWSNDGLKLAEITADTCGRHDALLAPCCQKTFDILYTENLGTRIGCHGQLALCLEEFGIGYYDIPTAFNVFMNVTFDSRGKIAVNPPISKPGDVLEISALRDVIVGLTACSAPTSNGGTCKSIVCEVEKKLS